MEKSSGRRADSQVVNDMAGRIFNHGIPMKKEADLPDARPGSGSCPGGPSDLDAIGLLLGRAYYAYLTQLGQCLKAHGIGGVVRPGMGNLRSEEHTSELQA